MNKNIKSVNKGDIYGLKNVLEKLLKICIALFYWIEQKMEVSRNEKRYKTMVWIYLAYLIMVSVISTSIIYLFMVIVLYFLNIKSQIKLDLDSYNITLIFCSILILLSSIQNIFNEHYNPARKIRILIQALLYKFSIKKFMIILSINIASFYGLFYLVKKVVNSYIKNYNIPVEVLNKIDTFEILFIFIIVHFIYVWETEDSVINVKRRLFLYVLSSTFLLVTTVNSLNELLIKSQYNTTNYNYMELIVIIIALLMSVDDVFDCLKELKTEYCGAIKEIEEYRSCALIFDEVNERRKCIMESMLKNKKQFLCEFRQIRKKILTLNTKQRLRLLFFMSVYFDVVISIIFATSKVESFISNDNIKIAMIHFMDSLPKEINVRIYYEYNHILKVVTIIIGIVCPIIICIGALKSINIDIKRVISNRYTIGLFIRELLCDLEIKFTIILIFIMVEIYIIATLYDININSFLRNFIYFTIQPTAIIFAISFICKKILDAYDIYRNKL